MARKDAVIMETCMLGTASGYPARGRFGQTIVVTTPGTETVAGRAIEQTVVTHFHPRWDGVPDAAILALIHRGAAERQIRGTVTLAREGARFIC